jgi:hypothetical protein
MWDPLLRIHQQTPNPDAEKPIHDHISTVIGIHQVALQQTFDGALGI